MARIDTLTNYLTDIADAIREKNNYSGTYEAQYFDDIINKIELAKDCYDENNVQDFFNGAGENTAVINTEAKAKQLLLYALVKKIPYMELDCSEITNNKLMHAFEFDYRLEEIDVSGWDVSTIENYRAMFFMCYNLKRLDLSNWTTTAANKITLLCKGCSSLTYADLSCFNGAFAIGELFVGCTSLQHIDIRGLDLVNSSGVKQSGNDFLGSSREGRVPTTCEIIVADATQKDYMTTNFASYTNVKTVAEYEAE